MLCIHYSSEKAAEKEQILISIGTWTHILDVDEITVVLSLLLVWRSARSKSHLLGKA